MEDAAARITRLESRLASTQRLLGLCVTGLVVMGAVLCLGGKGHADDLEATSLTIVDSSGSRKMLFNASGWKIFDANEKTRVSAGISSNKGYMGLTTPEGKNSVVLLQNDTSGFLTLSSPDESTTAGLLAQNGSANMQISVGKDDYVNAHASSGRDTYVVTRTDGSVTGRLGN